MKSRLSMSVLILAALALFALAIAWPTLALIGKCVSSGQPPVDGFTISPRQIVLLWRSTWISATATALCILVSLPGAYVVGRTRRTSNFPIIAAFLMVVLLCPPMVYVFGWDGLLPVGLDPRWRCVGVWAMWAWPIPALLIGSGWSRVGKRAYEAALLVTSPAPALFRIILPVLRRYIALSGLILFVLFFGDYGVPHACTLTVYATELLGWAQSSSHPIDAVWPALSSIMVTLLTLLGIGVAWRRRTDDDPDGHIAGSNNQSTGLTILAALCLLVSWVLPIAALAVRHASATVFLKAFSVYGAALTWSLGLALLSGVLAVGMGLGLAAIAKLRTVWIVWAFTFGALPGALIGESLLTAYNRDATWFIYDHWPILVLCYVARFGWIGVLGGILVVESGARGTVDQARLDGASEASVLRHVRLPASWPVLFCGAGIVAALSLADVPASALLRIPSVNPISHILIEKFHRFEDGMLVSLSFWLVLATLPAAMLLAVALRRRSSV